MYSKECLSRIKETANLIEVVREHLACRRVGKLFKALCPFHQETSPSFVVHEAGTHYHCFGCGAHGDVISFLMGVQRYSFREAVEWLSDKYGIPLSQSVSTELDQKGNDHRRILDCLQEAVQLFQAVLFYTDQGHQALEYLRKERGFDLSDCIRFKIGFAPARNAQDFFPGISLSLLKEAGLCRGSGSFFFANRIVFPISTWKDHVVGFTSRLLKEGKSSPKYVNTPDSPLFKKGEHFFGLAHARSAITRVHSVHLVEGPFDAMRLFQNGIENTLAVLGSSLTEMHVKRLLDLGVQRVYLIPDGDQAGLLALKKWGHLLIQNLIDVRVLQLPQGFDPDTFLLRNGLAAWKSHFDDPLDYISYLFHQDFPKPPTFAEKTKWVKSMLKLMDSWKDPILLHAALQQLSDLTQIEKSELVLYGKTQGPLPHVSNREEHSGVLLEREFIKLAVFLLSMDPNLVKEGLEVVKESMLFIEVWRRVRAAIDKVRGSKEAGLVMLILELGEGEAEQVEALGNPAYSLEKAKECFKHLCKELIKRDWLLQREKMRMEIQSGRLKDEEAIRMTEDLVRMGKSPPDQPW
ncbi:DNA primase [Candidatus Similichlamydia laticola]|uniref:DNA primase n=2 Tax=Candidatus Similichlamydia laticola TaxID=2170265 RepID=A0A369KFH3_9BACT|nr:DNA primase [Candidatus Similichlamydia laticola]